MAETAVQRSTCCYLAMQRSFLASSLIVPLVMWTLDLSGADHRSVTQPSVKQIAAEHLTYEKLTREPVAVNPWLAMLCRGASKSEVEKQRLQHGPHAHSMIEIRMNPLAAAAFKAGAKTYPVGSVMVKTKSYHSYVNDQGKMETPIKNGVGGMVKRSSGYDPNHGDWEYFFIDDVAKIESGRLTSCRNCHDTAKASDHVFGTWSRPSIPTELQKSPQPSPAKAR